MFSQRHRVLAAALITVGVLNVAVTATPEGSRGTAAPSVEVQSVGQYLVEFNGRIPEDLPQRIARLNGVLIDNYPEISVALAAIENSADDLGPPGADPFYGRGRINVARSLNVQ